MTPRKSPSPATRPSARPSRRPPAFAPQLALVIVVWFSPELTRAATHPPSPGGEISASSKAAPSAGSIPSACPIAPCIPGCITIGDVTTRNYAAFDLGDSNSYFYSIEAANTGGSRQQTRMR